MSQDSADELLRFIDASPTPFHVCRTVAAALDAAGWVRIDERDSWPSAGKPAGHYVIRGGSLVAWAAPKGMPASYRVVGGHTDSPNLRLKQHHDIEFEGAAVLALEAYGGPLLHTWLDRDLGVAGRLVLRDGSEHLVNVDEAVARVPRLAIHLDPESKGNDLDRQRHLNAVWGLGAEAFLPWLCEREDVRAGDVLGFDLMVHDVQPSSLIGANRELVSAPRLDNQLTCFAGLEALLAAESSDATPVLALFDHEEVGSASERGAQSDLLATVLERIVLGAGGTRDDLHRVVASSMCASGDMAHATHPNHPERHEPLHHITLGGGPVLKVNTNLRYASEPRGSAAFAVACEEAGVPLQRYVHRADQPCGSTIGPASAARTGMTTVDVGAPQLAMHSAREVMAAADVDAYARALTAFLST